MIILYSLLLVILLFYSYVLLDPNITFFQARFWEIFRESVIYLGYYRRDISWLIYLLIIITLIGFYYFFTGNYRRFNPFKLSLLVGVILLFSYPFLSHDFFNYMFDARIATFYKLNPYFYKALDFPSDPWIRFLQWTHRTYPYGPVFLLITLIPSFLSMGKFLLNFLFFKSVFVIFYLLAVYFLNKINKKQAISFAVHPLVIIEGLVNAHNDLIAVSFALIGIYFLTKTSGIKSRLLLLLSGGIKFLTLLLIFLSRKNIKWNRIILILLLVLLAYLTFKTEIQPWYYLNLLIFLPFFAKFINGLNIFFFGLLLSYYPYIRLGGWDKPEKILIKHYIIAGGIILNLIYLIFLKLNREKKTS